MSRNYGLIAVALLAVGCGLGAITEDTLPARVAGPYCDNLRRCNRGYFDSEFSDMADCVDETEEDFEDLVEEADDYGCDFDEDEARECVQSLRSSSCEDWYEGDTLDDCSDVFDDC